MKILKKIAAGVMAAAMAANMYALAADDTKNVTNPGETGNIPITITGEAYAFSVVVPTSIPLTLDKEGNVLSANKVKIINRSAAGVAVTGLKITAAEGWQLVNENTANTDMGTYSTSGGNKIYMEFLPNGQQAAKTGEDFGEPLGIISNALLKYWKMGASGTDTDTINITYRAKLPTMAQGADNITAANVVFVLAWDTD